MSRRRRRGGYAKYIWLMLTIAVSVVYWLQERRGGSAGRESTPESTPVAEGLPNMPVKPTPVVVSFRGCPPEGDGGDPLLNRLKNRSDEGDYIPIAFDALLRLPWPKRIERRDRDNWPAASLREVERYEGIPVAVEGYFAGAKESGPESTNCHGDERDLRDYHIWLVANPGEDRTRSIVVEVTPRLLAKNPAWHIKNLRTLIKAREQVRISGWLMLDPEHPDQVGKTRGTIWEIHPIMRIETMRGGRWRPLAERMLP